jgi:hypothetical protein
MFTYSFFLNINYARFKNTCILHCIYWSIVYLSKLLIFFSNVFYQESRELYYAITNLVRVSYDELSPLERLCHPKASKTCKYNSFPYISPFYYFPLKQISNTKCKIFISNCETKQEKDFMYTVFHQCDIVWLIEETIIKLPSSTTSFLIMKLEREWHWKIVECITPGQPSSVPAYSRSVI